ncbi:flagellar hook-length control protein FliK [Halolactibacillus sp. JCM 19043]|uniref:flagellar hook-length control protein FliK n=1 Tax=Halolactibacillus sp. JCM 19043 TaxID=1460638 RepID=UPI000781B467|nr:flagellar hook-length control protein FliK [Halolactibacillus sp. JCM 19043]
MNTMDMLFNQPAILASKPASHLGNSINNRDAQAFKKTLDQSSLNMIDSTNDASSNIRMIVNNLSHTNDTMSLESMMQDLNIDAGFSVPSLLSMLKDAADLSEKDITSLLEKLEALGLETESLMETLNIDMDNLSQEDMWQLSTLIQLQPVLEQILPMLKELNTDQLSSKDWLKLLDQFTGLPNDMKQVLSSKLLTEENQTLLKDMLAKFQSRMALSEKGYVTHGKVTTDDITKWLAQALDRQSGKSQPTFGEAFATSKGTQPLEQLTIHLSQSASTNQQTLNQELMDQFEAVLQKMQVGKNLLGQQQIKLQLNPNNLGQITVEMMEIDGEMFVKLIATSEMAKEALEANMKELRHMFSPHQVIVEQEEQAAIAHPSELLDYQEQDEQASNQEEPTIYIEEDEEAELSFSEILSQEGVYQ